MLLPVESFANHHIRSFLNDRLTGLPTALTHPRAASVSVDCCASLISSLCLQEPDDPGILLPAIMTAERYDFSMCNPPFFETASLANLNPDTACGGVLPPLPCDAAASRSTRKGVALHTRSADSDFKYILICLADSRTAYCMGPGTIQRPLAR